MATSRRFFDGAQEELGSLPIQATSQPTPPTPSTGITIFWIKENGTWKRCLAQFKQNNNWEQVLPYINILGDWK